MTNLTLVNLEDLKIILAENAIKNETTKGNIPGTKVGEAWRFSSLALKAFEISLVMYLVSGVVWQQYFVEEGRKIKNQISELAPIIGSLLALSIVSVQAAFKNQERLKWFLTGLGILAILTVFVEGGGD